MEPLLQTLAVAIAVSIVWFSMWYAVYYFTNDLSVVDIAWGTGFIVVAIATLTFNNNINHATYILFDLVLLWGTRLTLHILLRKMRNGGEDKRYTEIKKTWKGNVALRAYFRVFFTQAIILVLISIPILITNTYAIDIKNSFLAWTGIILWCIGFTIEFFADYQLYKFKNLSKSEKTKNGWKGNIMKYGVWKYSRHPNYFGEITVWIGVAVFALQYDYGILGLISPFVIIYLLLFISGIPIIEKKYLSVKEFQKYKKDTSPLIPIPTSIYTFLKSKLLTKVIS
jgi:steroid 5-alpha reductase family enzyme